MADNLKQSEYVFPFPIKSNTFNYRLYDCNSALIENTGDEICTINGSYPLAPGKNIELNPDGRAIDTILSFEFDGAGSAPQINIIKERYRDGN